MNVASHTLLCAALSVAAAAPAAAQEPTQCGYPERDILSPFRSPKDVAAPPDELFRNLRVMQNVARRSPELTSIDGKGRQVVDNDAWRQAYDRAQAIGIDAGMLAKMMRLHRNVDQRGVAFFAGFYCDNIGYVMELISHIPGEPARSIREQAFPKAVSFLRAHLGRRFGELTDEERAVVVANMPKPGSPAAKARGIQRAPRDDDHLHGLRLTPFFQLLDVEDPIDRAQALWFLKEVFRIRMDLASAWLEPALPRVKELLLSDSPDVRAEATTMFQLIGPADLPPPPEAAPALRAWADRASKHLFPPIRNLNDTIVQLFPSAERDALVEAAVAALENDSIGDPFRGRGDDGAWYTGYRIARVPDAPTPLAIPAEAVITSINGVTVDSGAAVLTIAKKFAQRARPTRVLVEYVRKGKRHAVEYRIM